MLPTSPPHLPHLRALDGLRGVAVALVVAYHLAPDLVPGGFLGVDVFFVLSGFLITSLLVVEVEATNGVDLARFYVRRLRRLLPALLLLLLAVAGYAAFLASPGELARIREHSIWTLGYLANWRYIADGTTYTDLVAGQSPLRHTWSLAIEEQFYLVFPFLVLALTLAARRRARRVRAWLAVAAPVGTLASAGLMAWVWTTSDGPTRGYFGTDTRAHSLLVGVFLGAVFAGRPPAGLGAARWLGSGGTLVLVAAVAAGHEDARWLHQGGFLVVALAVGAVIASLGRDGWLAAGLSWSPLVGLGLISYGVYLWHWPVVVLVNGSRTGMAGPVLALAQVALTLALALTSYALVERPIRRGVLGARLGAAAPMAVGGAVATLAVVVLAATVVPSLAPPAAARPSGGSPAPSSAGTGDAGPMPLVVFGDSVAHTIAGGQVADFPRFTPWDPSQSPFDPARVVAHSEARPACSFLPGEVLIDGGAADLQAFCGPWREDLGRALAARTDAVLLVALFNDASDRRVHGADIALGTPAHTVLVDDLLDELLALVHLHGDRLALVALPPREGAFVRSGDEGGRRELAMRALYRDYAARREGVEVLDLFEAICPTGDCSRPADGFDREWRYDGLHFTPEGAAWVAGWLTEALVRPPR